ncbi:hypothetical protein [uncultured Sunxiuqinia sp.]|uniref:hypothetical protein n=1 Tax=uncultured Sunxiuqinia sp. TaxID=1573825 RepID=UPI002AA5F4E4|nr:hypothetical protein [uncultured Sunxiuqinia sp.]
MIRKDIFKITFILILPYLIISSGCARIECASFPENKESWLPYNYGDTLFLISQIDTIVLPIVEISTSDSYYTSWSDDYSYCHSNKYIKTETDSSKYVNLSIDILTSENMPDSLMDFDILIGKLADTFYGSPKSDFSTFKNSVLIDGIAYDNVISINSLENNRFQEIILIKGIGVYKLISNNSTIYKIKGL